MHKRLAHELTILTLITVMLVACGDSSSGQPVATNTADRVLPSRDVVVFTPEGGKLVFDMVKAAMKARGLTYDIKIMEGVTTEVTIKGLQDGMFDLIFLHRMPRPDEGIEFFEVVRVNVAIFTHPDITVDNLTTKQIGAIFSGEITNWADVGGPDQDIVVFGLPEFDSTTEALRVIALGERPFANSMQMFPDETSALLSATGIAGGITYSTWATKKYLELIDPAASNQEFHVISIDGLSVGDPNYPMNIVLGFGYLPTQAESLTPLLDWLSEFMQSPQGGLLLQLFDVGTMLEE